MIEQSRIRFSESLQDIILKVKHILGYDNSTARELDLNQTLLSILKQLNYDNKELMRGELIHYIIDSYNNMVLGERVLQLIAQPKKPKRG